MAADVEYKEKRYLTPPFSLLRHVLLFLKKIYYTKILIYILIYLFYLVIKIIDIAYLYIED